MSNLDSTSVLSAPPSSTEQSEDDPPQGGRGTSSRRGLIINLVISLALLVVLALIVWTVRGTSDEPTTTAQTAEVSTGNVTATVSANGNIATGSEVNVDFQGSGGVVTAILVEPGDKVRKGQVLARIDDTSARQSLALALTQLDSALAAYAGTVEGQTAEEQAQDSRTVDQAEASVRSAQTSLDSALQTLSLTTRQQNEAVARAEDAVSAAEDTLEAAQKKQSYDPSPENRQAVQTARTALQTARSALITARETRASSLLQARQSVASARDQLASARSSLEVTKAGVAVNRQGPRDSEIESAQAQVDNAQVGLAQARTTLSQTVLRAPASGTVAQISGTVGEPSTGSGSSTDSTSSTTDTGTSSGSATTTASGFLTLTDTDALQVTADVAEADIAEVKIGQDASITLAATGKEVSGTVTAVDAIETVTNNVVEYGVTVTLSESKGIKLGQSTQVVVTTGAKQGVVRVSASALTTIGDRTTATVQSEDGASRTVDVVIGLEGDGYTEVLSGLSAGDTVVLPEQAEAPSDFTFPGGGGIGGLG